MSTRDRILKIAGDLFRKKGYDQVTVQDISDASGISKNTFYYHFTSKREVLEESVDGVPDSLSKERMEKIFTTDIYFERYWLLIEPYVQYFIENGPAYCQKFLRSSHIQSEREEFFIRPQEKGFVGLEIILLKKSREAGEINNRSSLKDLARLSYNQVMILGTLWAYQNGVFDLEKAVRNAVECILDLSMDLRKATGYFDEIAKIIKKNKKQAYEKK